MRCLAAPQTYFEELHPSVAEQVSVLHQNQVGHLCQLGDLLHWKTQLSKVMIGETSGSSDRTCFFVEWKKYENMRIKAGLAETQCDLENMVAEECCGIETPEQVSRFVFCLFVSFSLSLYDSTCYFVLRLCLYLVTSFVNDDFAEAMVDRK